MSTTTTTRSYEVASVDLVAALRHDKRIATAEGFTGVAERAAASLEFLENALDEFCTAEPGTRVTVAITVTATA